ncbi:hypothetical protein [Leptolyngbya sp. FACHB-16]|uniref:hypothetical protein n=1 Tax=unclassified Leptolyngbya TaxID=2650499 RepID=UPI001683DB33|nr:hypothetical protein [Leptolyngbya sp. FACHB-16]MBD2155226.1 hypothetical protein [Leptolyngbya sp. FACHB-16]
MTRAPALAAGALLLGRWRSPSSQFFMGQWLDNDLTTRIAPAVSAGFCLGFPVAYKEASAGQVLVTQDSYVFLIKLD